MIAMWPVFPSAMQTMSRALIGHLVTSLKVNFPREIAFQIARDRRSFETQVTMTLMMINRKKTPQGVKFLMRIQKMPFNLRFKW
jgi:hypothetical protein